MNPNSALENKPPTPLTTHLSPLTPSPSSCSPHGRNFETLECWKSGREVRLFVHRRVLPCLEPDESRRLKDQLVRAGRSITANIAEGYGRFHYLETAKFCSIARGSNSEVLDHLITAVDECLIPPEILEEARPLISSTEKLINGFMRYLKRTKSGGEQSGGK